MFPNLRNEKRLWRKGHKKIAGLDEAGRGPLSGPVTAAAVIIKPIRGKFVKIREIKDSKKLTPKKREELYKILTNHPQIDWGIGKVSEKVIDKINILEATELAMKKAVRRLKRKPVFLILDGNLEIDLEIPQKSIKKADEKVFSCACASILAKVYRDRVMRRFHRKYPRYGFDKHKGYPTKLHFKMLKKYGSCKIHRKSFKPVIKYQKSKRTLRGGAKGSSKNKK
ncbi:ribonuclease HII [Patescibacteria group bacterium]|nr:ribonuclease HII [Patescibacteria group bacterium]